MRERDKRILKSLEKFKVLDAKQLCRMHFHNDWDQNNCNNVMRRLIKKGYVTVNTDIKPYDYYLNPAPIKKGSVKTLHHKAIADFYMDLCKWGKPMVFQVEPSLGHYKRVIPDAFVYDWNKTILFCEVQITPQKDIVMPKYEKYVEYFYSGQWKDLPWQPKEPVFPKIWLLTDRYYDFPEEPLTIYQSKSVRDFYYKYIV